MKIFWVKKLVKTKEWENWYSRDDSYTFLNAEGSGVWIGFLVPHHIPSDCLECEDEEIVQIDQHRRAKNIRPFPLKELSQQENEEQVKVLGGLQKSSARKRMAEMFAKLKSMGYFKEYKDYFEWEKYKYKV